MAGDEGAGDVAQAAQHLGVAGVGVEVFQDEEGARPLGALVCRFAGAGDEGDTDGDTNTGDADAGT